MRRNLNILINNLYILRKQTLAELSTSLSSTVDFVCDFLLATVCLTERGSYVGCKFYVRTANELRCKYVCACAVLQLDFRRVYLSTFPFITHLSDRLHQVIIFTVIRPRSSCDTYYYYIECSSYTLLVLKQQRPGPAIISSLDQRSSVTSSSRVK